MIINCQGETENRYKWISQDIGNRFSTKMSVVTETGFLPPFKSKFMWFRKESECETIRTGCLLLRN